MNKFLLFLLVVMMAGCRFHYEVNWYNDSDINPISVARAHQLDNAFNAWVKEHRINTAGIGIIKSGELVWEGYYGEQSPGVPANELTLFNVASITKTVTVETILRLASEDKLSLDEPMSEYWLDPDLISDPRHSKLTARMALQHRSGFLNWRFFSADNKLAFVNEPGSQYGYSGEGTDYLAKYAENKLGQPFETLVDTMILEPLGMVNTAISNRSENHLRMAKPYSSEGDFYGYYCRPEGWCAPEGYVSVADDMVTTVQDYAKFLKSAMHGEGLSKKIRKARNQISQDLISENQVNCDVLPDTECPEAEGYGLGWYVVEPNGNQLVGHGGSDWSEMSQAYFYTGSHDGVIIFINAPSKRAIKGMIAALKIVDPKSAKIHEYNNWLVNSK